MGLFGGTPEGTSGDDNFGSKLRSSYGGGETDSFSSGGQDLGGAAGGDLQQQMAMMEQSVQLTKQVHKLNETCWDVCVGSPSSSLSGREETCLANCVDRFIDTGLLITNRFAQLAQKMGR
eukprot:GFUD01034616.1.p1 GENE.GFUD01034616.1~~GFUD01034616.1.p1  ORF type:complete len:120 (-),score=52.39 GFUD01034616.1:97-456(-)